MDLAAPHATMRPFGDPRDLGLDFGHPDRSVLVTALLAQCTGRSDPVFWWSQPVGVRIGALLRLVALTETDAPALPFASRCTNASCGEPFQFELPLAAVSDRAGETRPVHVLLDDGRSVTMRRPTGDDLRRWRATRAASRAGAMRAVIDALVLDGEVQEDDLAVVARSIAAADPLVAFSVSCSCPACDATHEVAIDLEGVALGRLAAHQQALLRDVHCLASHYGWTESEVLAVPPARRARYRALIEEQP